MSQSKQLRLGIGIPAYGGKVSAEHTRMFLELGHALASSEARFMVTMPIAIVDVCQVDKARSMLVDMAIEADCTWLLQIDSDTWVEDPYTLLQMISDADRAMHSVAVAAVPRRNLDGSRELMVYSPDGAAYGDLYLQAHPDDLVPIAAAATACMAVRMDVVKRLDQPWFRFTERRSEDLDFCDRIRERGHTLVCDRRVKARHLNRPAILHGLG